MTNQDELGWGELIDSDNPRCVGCGGELRPLGALGHVLHFRCRNCGLDQTGEANSDIAEMDEIMYDDCLTSPFEGLDELVEDPDAMDEDLLYELAREEEELWNPLD